MDLSGRQPRPPCVGKCASSGGHANARLPVLGCLAGPKPRGQGPVAHLRTAPFQQKEGDPCLRFEPRLADAGPLVWPLSAESRSKSGQILTMSEQMWRRIRANPWTIPDRLSSTSVEFGSGRPQPPSLVCVCVCAMCPKFRRFKPGLTRIGRWPALQEFAQTPSGAPIERRSIWQSERSYPKCEEKLRSAHPGKFPQQGPEMAQRCRKTAPGDEVRPRLDQHWPKVDPN